MAAKDLMNSGDRIFLPVSVREVRPTKQDCPCTEEEIDFIRSLEFYKVLNFSFCLVGMCVFCII